VFKPSQFQFVCTKCKYLYKYIYSAIGELKNW